MDVLLITILGLTPSMVWLIFFVREHKLHPEPKSLILFAFLLGGLTTFLAYYAQLYTFETWFFDVPKTNTLPVLVFATIEEIVKLLGIIVFVKAALPRKRFIDPLRPMIYGITVALGFAAVENIGLLISQGAVGNVDSGIVFELLVLRFIGATLLHGVATGIIGFHWAGAIVKKSSKVLHILAGLAIASLLHGVFNYLIISYGPTIWPIAFVIFISFIVLVDFEELKEADI